MERGDSFETVAFFVSILYFLFFIFIFIFIFIIESEKERGLSIVRTVDR
jgi:hypothetical protein